MPRDRHQAVLLSLEVIPLSNQWTLGLKQIGPTDEQMAKIIAAAEHGYSLSSIAAAADLSKNTLHHWEQQGHKAFERAMAGEELTQTEAIYAAFSERFEQARAKGVKANEDRLDARAAEGSGAWTASAWKLERGHRDEFGKQPDVIAGGGGPVVIVIENRPSRELEHEVVEGELVESDDDPSALPAASTSAGVS